jgi:RNA polymerase sigma-70 factor, ECF subfamily
MFYVTETKTNELIVGLQNKSEAAFSTLYDDYASALLSVTFRIVKNQTVAEELLQDVFIKIWKHIDTYDATKGTLFTWMLNIAQNTCKDYFRSKQYHYQTLLAQNGLDIVPSTCMPQTVCYQEETHDLPRLIQSLDPKYRQIIDLVYIYGYSQEQVSEKLDIPLGTVKTRSRMALKQLRYIYTL